MTVRTGQTFEQVSSSVISNISDPVKLTELEGNFLAKLQSILTADKATEISTLKKKWVELKRNPHDVNLQNEVISRIKEINYKTNAPSLEQLIAKIDSAIESLGGERLSDDKTDPQKVRVSQVVKSLVETKKSLSENPDDIRLKAQALKLLEEAVLVKIAEFPIELQDMVISHLSHLSIRDQVGIFGGQAPIYHHVISNLQRHFDESHAMPVIPPGTAPPQRFQTLFSHLNKRLASKNCQIFMPRIDRYELMLWALNQAPNLSERLDDLKKGEDLSFAEALEQNLPYSALSKLGLNNPEQLRAFVLKFKDNFEIAAEPFTSLTRHFGILSHEIYTPAEFIDHVKKMSNPDSQASIERKISPDFCLKLTTVEDIDKALAIIRKHHDLSPEEEESIHRHINSLPPRKRVVSTREVP